MARLNLQLVRPWGTTLAAVLSLALALALLVPSDAEARGRGRGGGGGYSRGGGGWSGSGGAALAAPDAGSCTRSDPCTGPRGGRYYFTASGNKRYVPR